MTPVKSPAPPTPSELARRQRWPWWPLLPLYPYGRRRTLVRELIPDQVWSFEQLQGVFYVAVPIRMTAVRLQQGLLLYAPLPPTGELRAALRKLELRWGPVRTIVLPTSSGLEHKLPLPALARAFPKAQVWVTPGQWSFPLRLPPSWLGFPVGRTHVLFEEGLPHSEELAWERLGPLDLGLGRFEEAACLHRASGSLLVTDALVVLEAEPPALFDLDPTPLLFHARERGDEPLQDSPEARRRGWRRLLLFASFLRPQQLEVPPLGEVLAHSLAPGLRNPRSHFGLYPFRWSPGWEAEAEGLLAPDGPRLQVAPVLERLVFPRARGLLLDWLQRLSRLEPLRQLVPAHYSAPVPLSAEQLLGLAAELETRPWARDGGSWSFLAGIDHRLLAWGLVPRSAPEVDPSHGT